MTNPSNLVITGLDGYFILNFLQKSGYFDKNTIKISSFMITYTLHLCRKKYGIT